MKDKALWRAVCIISVVALAAATSALAQNPPPTHLSGLINDFTAQTGSSPTVGPWELHGTWSLNMKGKSGKADFSAAMTMEEGDYWLSANSENPTQDPVVRAQHTHHITMTNATVSYNATDTSMCPADNPANPKATERFVVTGPADITANGSPAPFQVAHGISTVQVCISGGTDIEFSNVTLVFSYPANTHFGSQAIHGVVRKVTHFGDGDGR